MRNIPFLLFLVCCALSACFGSNADSPSPPPDDRAPYSGTNSAEELDILEAVFRYQFEHNMLGAGALGRLDHLFLALGPESAHVDPPAELLARFAGHSPPIEPVSAADRSGGGAYHRTSRGRGVIFRVERLRPIESGCFDVDGGYFSNGKSASGNTYRVRLRKGSWTVVADGMWWIS